MMRILPAGPTVALRYRQGLGRVAAISFPIPVLRTADLRTFDSNEVCQAQKEEVLADDVSYTRKDDQFVMGGESTVVNTRGRAAAGKRGRRATELSRLVKTMRRRLSSDDFPNWTGAAKKRIAQRDMEGRLAGGYSWSWYQSLERGHLAAYSDDFLESVAKTLRFGYSQRCLLFWLAVGRSAPGSHPASRNLKSALGVQIDYFDFPAWTWDLYGRIDYENAEVSRWLPAGAAEAPNFLRWIIIDPEARLVLPKWETTWAPAALAYIKMTAAMSNDDPTLMALVDTLVDVGLGQTWDRLDAESITPAADVHERALWLNTKDGPTQVRLVTLGSPGAHELRQVTLMPESKIAGRIAAEDQTSAA